MDLVVSIVGGSAVVVAEIEGEIDLSNAADLESRLVGALTEGKPMIVDLRRVGYLDSSALATLHRISLAARDRTLQMRVVTGDQDMAHRLLSITGLDEVLRPCASVEDAVASLEMPGA